MSKSKKLRLVGSFIMSSAYSSGLSRLFECLGLSHVAADVLCLLDLRTFCFMELVSRDVALSMASAGVWRRRLLMVEGR